MLIVTKLCHPSASTVAFSFRSWMQLLLGGFFASATVACRLLSPA